MSGDSVPGAAAAPRPFARLGRKALAAGALLLIIVPGPAIGRAAGAGTRPHALVLTIKGKRVPIVPIVGGSDDYHDLHARTMAVAASWTGDAGSSGYVVRISTSEPQEKVYAVCATGTSCRVPRAVTLPLDQEMSWQVEVLTAKGHRSVAGYKYCLVGRK